MSRQHRRRGPEARLCRRDRPRAEAAGARERWAAFLAFWLSAALVLLACGIGTLVAVHHGRRLGTVFLLLALVCVGVASIVRRGTPRDG